MDDIDRAQDAAEFMREIDLINESERHEAQIAANGTCHNCGETIGQGLRWCDTFCRDDYDKRQRAEARRGR